MNELFPLFQWVLFLNFNSFIAVGGGGGMLKNEIMNVNSELRIKRGKLRMEKSVNNKQEKC